MLDWLRRPPREGETIELGDRALPLAIRRHDRARRMTLRLAPDGSEVRVTIPRWGRSADARAFAQSRADWLAAQLDRLPAAPRLEPGAMLSFRGESLRLVHSSAARRAPMLRDGELHVGGAIESLPQRLERWLRREALALSREDLQHYCTRARVTAPRLMLTSARRRWGSCSAKGTIRINWRLVMAPDAIRRSVIAHEVAHLVHFDHSPRFHALLDEIYEGDIATANRWLKREGAALNQWFTQ